MITEQAQAYRKQIISLLTAEKLPVADVAETLDNFIVALEGGFVIGVAGIEIYNHYGLLRSLAVVPHFRKNGIASDFIRQAEQITVSKNLRSIYLLTETAEAFFIKKGYQTVNRDSVPLDIHQSAQFKYICRKQRL